MTPTFLRNAREAAGISQGALAPKLGISKSYFSLMEEGRRPIKGHVEARIKSTLMPMILNRNLWLKEILGEA